MDRRRAYELWACSDCQPQIIDGVLITPPELERLHRYLLRVDRLDFVSGSLRPFLEAQWPELAHKLPPKGPQA